ncbi:hypothetical protein M3E13_09380 [Oceanobacillus kimchii]|uniref:STM3941 family protein n=1 Tax=Oceanobacillus kimchii TaxID=746691 RepID=UPI0003466607|nr:STM3941 family protein [Oceanobacillus kimchii]MCT1576493.1 hypothetical protein [Oceanobacillus kimchii]MCT2136129.1 hypothetical protein [Oceanobacillus kimchii]
MKTKYLLHFYPSKLKILFLIIFILPLLGGSPIFVVAGIKEQSLLVSGIGLFTVVFSGILFYFGLRRLISRKSYITLTDEELILNVTTVTIPIQWGDIRGFLLKESFSTKFIEVTLFNEEKYRELLSNKKGILTKMNKLPITISLVHIKRKDRKIVFDEFDRRTPNLSYKIYDQLKDEQLEKREYRQINRKYMLKSYIIGVIISIGAYILFGLTDDSYHVFVFVGVILYPFAKVFYDILLGFKLRFKADKQKTGSLYLDQLDVLFNIFVYMFSIVIAPLGILYLIIKAVSNSIKKRI